MTPSTAVAVPAAPLRAYVARYVQVALDVPAGEVLRQRVSAAVAPVLGVHMSGDAVVDTIGETGQVTECCLIAPLTRLHDNLFSGAVRGFFVHFTPSGALALFGARGCGMPDLATPLPELLDRAGAGAAREWVDELLHARSFAARVAATDRLLLWFLRRRLRGTPTRLGLIGAAVGRIEARRGLVRVSTLAWELGASERTLRRRFHEEMGLPVKRFARVARFRHAHTLLQHTGARWPEVVVRLGYADQGHLIRDYQEFSGASPTRYDVDDRFLDTAASASDVSMAEFSKTRGRSEGILRGRRASIP